MTHLTDRVIAFCDWLDTIPPDPPFHQHPDFRQFSNLTGLERAAAFDELRRRAEVANAEADALEAESLDNVIPLRMGQPISASSEDPFEFRVHEPTLDVTTAMVGRLLNEVGPVEGHPVAAEVHSAIATVLFHLQFAVKLTPAKTIEDQIAIVGEAAFLWLLLRLREPDKVLELFAEITERTDPIPPEVA